MRRILLSILICVLFSLPLFANEKEGIRIWGLSFQKFAGDTSYVIRTGYETKDFLFNDSNNTTEIFIGTTLMPKQENEEGITVEPPETLALGFIYHMGNLITADEGIPWISNALWTIFPQGVSAKSYAGGQATVNFVDEAGYIGFLTGLKIKLNPKSKFEIVTEAQYNNLFYDLSGLKDDDQAVFCAGLRIPF